jgi:hypothetical protein
LLLIRNAPATLVRGRLRGRPVDRLLRPGCDAGWSALHVLATGI